MYTKEYLMRQLGDMGVNPKGTLLVHSSMKSIGPVEGRADTVLDAFSEYMKDGLLLFPAQTWDQVSAAKGRDTYYPASDPTCNGILPQLFWQRPGVVRSLHPTHAMAGLGKGAAEYLAGEEHTHSPCARNGCWGRLYDVKAQILLLGVALNRNTFIHSVEEEMDIPNRLRETEEILYTVTAEGKRYTIPQHRHFWPVAEHYVKMEKTLLERGAMERTRFGDADCLLCDAVRVSDVIRGFLRNNPSLFDTPDPLPED